MRRGAMWLLGACVAAVSLARGALAEPDLTAAQIIEKNAAARGGLEAWRKIQTMVFLGHVENARVPAQFVLAQKRPNKTRFEMMSPNQMAVRVFDGAQGWKLRIAHGAGPNLQPYTQEELKFAQDEPIIDGPLIDNTAKGIKVGLEGIDEVEGHKAYRLSVRLPSGASRHMWVDAQTFLDIKYDREARNAVGQPTTVSVFYRNYQAFEGLQIPLVIEASAAMTKATDRLVIDKILLNPTMDDSLFAKPAVPRGNQPGSGKPERLDSEVWQRFNEMGQTAPAP